eukprot:557009-Rhodomonas_salina.1
MQSRFFSRLIPSVGVPYLGVRALNRVVAVPGYQARQALRNAVAAITAATSDQEGDKELEKKWASVEGVMEKLGKVRIPQVWHCAQRDTEMGNVGRERECGEKEALRWGMWREGGTEMGNVLEIEELRRLADDVERMKEGGQPEGWKGEGGGGEGEGATGLRERVLVLLEWVEGLSAEVPPSYLVWYGRLCRVLMQAVSGAGARADRKGGVGARIAGRCAEGVEYLGTGGRRERAGRRSQGRGWRS